MLAGEEGRRAAGAQGVASLAKYMALAPTSQKLRWKAIEEDTGYYSTHKCTDTRMHTATDTRTGTHEKLTNIFSES